MNTRENPSYSEKRTRETIKFCDITQGEIVLDIAAPNELSRQMAIAKGIVVVNTVSDLDYKIIPEESPVRTYKYATCFEVIEHLLNPRLFMDNLHKKTTDDCVVYLSYPSRPDWLQNKHEHFNEYTRERFEYLLEKTGWTISDEKKIYVRRKPNGIRPIIRNFLPQTTIYKLIKK